AVEQEFSLSVARYELIPDSGGPGRFRGGLGTPRDMGIWSDQGRLAGRGLRQAPGAPPPVGGAPGQTRPVGPAPGSNHETKLPSSFSELATERGAVVRVETPSGAGYGDPLERELERVIADVVAGKVSAEGARRDYGVVVRDGQLDRDATIAERARLR